MPESWARRVVTLARSVAGGLARALVIVALTAAAPAMWVVAFIVLRDLLGSVAAAAACVLALVTVSLVVAARPLAAAGRMLVRRWTGSAVPVAYRPLVPIARMATGYWWNGYDYQRYRLVSLVQRWIRARVRDPASWRDMLWVVVSPLTAGLAAAAPFALLAGGISALAGVTPAVGSLTPVIGVLMLLAGTVLLPWAWRVVGPVARGVFESSTLAQLTSRVETLTDSRADLTRIQEEELHRIERNLHDGAQSRLIAIGLSLGTAERLIDDDPAGAKAVIRDARELSLSAVRELRDLVHGIVPPVLLERGLVDAIRALALDAPLPARVHSTLTRSLEMPVESALYFATSELMTNAVKHSGASAVEITIERTHAGVGITVADDGIGGARETPGSGLEGVRRRLAAFDGRMDVHSPSGGPTRITVEVPCASS